MARLSREALEDIQGIILSGYGHLNFGAFLFLQVREPPAGRSWLDRVVPEVTSAERWPIGPDGEKIKPDTTLNLAFTYPGAQALGLPEQALATFSPEFREGVVRKAPILGDTGHSSPEHWDVGGPNNRVVHVLVMLFGRDAQSLARHCQRQLQLVDESDGGVVLVLLQLGARPESHKEPFGFRDGLSNPLIEGTEGHPDPGRFVVKTGEFVLGYINEYGIYPLSPSVLRADDPEGILPAFPEQSYPEYRDFGRHGSYLAYRKLQQDVEGFWRYVQEQHSEGETVNHAAAVTMASKFVGRWPSGAPMVLTPERDNPPLARDNTFTYSLDPDGFACPAGAHIRRANPRASLAHNKPDQSFSSVNTHRVMRRAVSYGGEDGLSVEHAFDALDLDEGRIPVDHRETGPPRGIHFLAINADLGRQFELVLQNWINNGDFNALDDNKDPLIGSNDCTGNMTIPRDPVRWRALDLPRFVTTRGSGYFFLPSRTALRYVVSLDRGA